MYYYYQCVLMLFLVPLCVFNAAAAQQIRNSNITLGSSLTPTSNVSSWFSPSRVFAFGFFPTNNGQYAVGIFLASLLERTVIWTANRDNNPNVPDNVRLKLTDDGRLILQSGPGSQDIYVVNIPNSEPIATASMLDNGNLILYSSDSRIIWQSFDHPTDTLLPGQRLSPEQELVSSASLTNPSRGLFSIKMQDDGNLVQYPVNSPYAPPYAYYASNTGEFGNNISLNLENDGHLYLLNGNSTTVLKNLTKGGYPTVRTINLARIDVGGIFRLYSRSLDDREGNWTVRWSTTDDPCAPIGLCGLNGFCVQIDQIANCTCLPGFYFVQPGNWTAGCSKNFEGGGCRDKDPIVHHEIRTVENVAWENNSYDTVETITIEWCTQACLEDCKCDAAFFQDGQCSKQRLPLRFGRRSLYNSNDALVKMRVNPVDIPVPQANEDPSTSKSYCIPKFRLGLVLCHHLVSLFNVYFNSRMP